MSINLPYIYILLMPTHMLINLDNSLYRKIQNIRSQDMTYIYIYCICLQILILMKPCMLCSYIHTYMWLVPFQEEVFSEIYLVTLVTYQIIGPELGSTLIL